MVSTKVKSNTSLKEKEKKEEKKTHISEIKNSSCPQEIIEHIQDTIDKYKIINASLTFCKDLKKSLDKNFKKEWNVFMGKHFCGSVASTENGYVELTINGDLRVIVFRSISGF